MKVFQYDEKNELEAKYFIEYKNEDGEGRSESALQNFIFQNPKLFPVVECSGGSATRWIPIAMEITLEDKMGRLDIFATDNDGNVYILECKLEANHDTKTVRSQITNYAAGFRNQITNTMGEGGFWKWLEDNIKTQSPTHESLEEILKKDKENNVKKIIENMKENFKNDNIVLIYAVDEIYPSLCIDIDFWNQAVNTENNYPSFAYEVKRYSDAKDNEQPTSVITQTYPFDIEGLLKSRRKNSDRKIFSNDIEVWKDKLRQSELNKEQQKKITEFKDKLYDLIKKGEGTSSMSFGNGQSCSMMPKFERFSKRSPIGLFPNGELRIQFDLLDTTAYGPRYPEVAEKFKNKLIELDEIRDRVYQNNKTKSPNLKFEEWIPVKDEILKILEELFIKIQE